MTLVGRRARVVVAVALFFARLVAGCGARSGVDAPVLEAQTGVGGDMGGTAGSGGTAAAGGATGGTAATAGTAWTGGAGGATCGAGGTGGGGGTGGDITVGMTGVIAAGLDHACALVNGAVQCWGSNGNGQLGNESTADSLVPVLVSAWAP